MKNLTIKKLPTEYEILIAMARETAFKISIKRDGESKTALSAIIRRIKTIKG